MSHAGARKSGAYLSSSQAIYLAPNHVQLKSSYRDDTRMVSSRQETLLPYLVQMNMDRKMRNTKGNEKREGG